MGKSSGDDLWWHHFGQSKRTLNMWSPSITFSFPTSTTVFHANTWLSTSHEVVCCKFVSKSHSGNSLQLFALQKSSSRSSCSISWNMCKPGGKPYWVTRWNMPLLVAIPFSSPASCAESVDILISAIPVAKDDRNC